MLTVYTIYVSKIQRILAIYTFAHSITCLDLKSMLTKQILYFWKMQEISEKILAFLFIILLWIK